VDIQFLTLPHCYGNSHAIWDHTVLPAKVTFRVYCLSTLILDLVTLEGCKAELT